jgi:hypothetical protein
VIKATPLKIRPGREGGHPSKPTIYRCCSVIAAGCVDCRLVDALTQTRCLLGWPPSRSACSARRGQDETKSNAKSSDTTAQRSSSPQPLYIFPSLFMIEIAGQNVSRMLGPKNVAYAASERTSAATPPAIHFSTTLNLCLILPPLPRHHRADLKPRPLLNPSATWRRARPLPLPPPPPLSRNLVSALRAGQISGTLTRRRSSSTAQQRPVTTTG